MDYVKEALELQFLKVLKISKRKNSQGFSRSLDPMKNTHDDFAHLSNLYLHIAGLLSELVDACIFKWCSLCFRNDEVLRGFCILWDGFQLLQ
ncbi:hypothetical protein Nepgr_015779 [Nepenthes gracilis]|uniref:Uncharacterized protein n=1 Tax=Nepenthes gracilis TaxID=150966 RepID=A0AAD3SLM1_NEPGR|nr:hypothetical protein Nepgr_015779 [Nepenthes gracilis]